MQMHKKSFFPILYFLDLSLLTYTIYYVRIKPQGYSFQEFLGWILPFITYSNNKWLPGDNGINALDVIIEIWYKYLNTAFGWALIILIICIDILILVALNKYLISEIKKDAKANQGTAALVGLSYYLKKFGGVPGFRITDEFIYNWKKCCEGLIIFGPNRSGKSAGYVIPNLINKAFGKSSVINR